jgi:SAM-dependent methyltransferase
VTYDRTQAAAFYDAYGEREWTRFEDGRTPSTSVATHAHYLGRFVTEGDRVLDVGCGPGRFTIELARLGARVVAADVSSVQLDLHRRFVADAGAETSVEDRVVADIVDLSQFADDEFDLTICLGGPLSYVLDEAPRASAELARVTRPGGHVLVSVMCLLGSTLRAPLSQLVAEFGAQTVRDVTSTGALRPEHSNGHLEMKLYRWRELEALLAPHGTIIAGAAAGIFAAVEDCDLELAESLELDLGAEPGSRETGNHMIAVLEVGA